MRTGNLRFGISFEQFLHAGRATIVLVHAHHHGSVVSRIELPETHEALLLYFILDDGFHLFWDAPTGQYLHGLTKVIITK